MGIGSAYVHRVKAESLGINSVGHRPMVGCKLETIALKGRNQFDVRLSA